jgi:virginiamycin B lyase
MPTSIPSSPTGITAGPDGNVWFTDQGNTLNLQTHPPTVLPIGLITPTGAISQFPLPAQPFQGPSGIVTGPDGALWFGVGLTNNVIGRITTGGSATSFPIPTHNASSTTGIINISVGSDGALWFTEPDAGKIGRVTTGGTITEFPTLQPGSQPWGITPGPDGALWFTDRMADLIGRITLSRSAKHQLLMG